MASAMDDRDLVIDGARAAGMARRLSFPRFPGGPGERKARHLLRDEMRRSGYIVEEQPFQYDSRRADQLRLAMPLYPFLALGACVLLHRWAPVSAWIAATVLLAAPLALRWRWIERLFEGDREHSANLVARRPEARREDGEPLPASTAGPGAVRVLFMAHIDSKSQPIGVVLRGVLATAIVLTSVTVWGALGLRALGVQSASAAATAAASATPSAIPQPVKDHFLNLPLAILLACALPLALNRNSDLSPGAIDNAAGCALLVELARSLRHATDLPYEPVFAFTGAEEVGMVGSARLARRALSDQSLDRSSCLFVNLESPGAGKRLLALSHGPRRRSLASAAREAGVECGVPLRTIRLIPAAGVDGVPMGSRGYRGVTLTSGPAGRAVRSIHTKADRAENIDPAAMEAAARASLALARRLAAM
jgi:hypothetical protein